MQRLVEKVTAFVVRRSGEGFDLLLFEHPHAGIQIPAGTVEIGETPDRAVLRETAEESGLTELAACHYLGHADDVLPPDRRVMAEQTRVYARPDTTSFDWARLPRGLQVRLERQAPGFAQVTYEELDDLVAPRYASYRITGWVPDGVLADRRRRHFYRLDFAGSTPDRWTVETDHHRFTLFWAPLSVLPAIVYPQNTWLDMLRRSSLP